MGFCAAFPTRKPGACKSLETLVGLRFAAYFGVDLDSAERDFGAREGTRTPPRSVTE